MNPYSLLIGTGIPYIGTMKYSSKLYTIYAPVEAYDTYDTVLFYMSFMML